MEKYLVWCPEFGSGPDDGREIMAHDHEDAACIWARSEDADGADYWIVGGDGASIVVRDPGGDEKALRVTGETIIQYRVSAA